VAGAERLVTCIGVAIRSGAACSARAATRIRGAGGTDEHRKENTSDEDGEETPQPHAVLVGASFEAADPPKQ
jgi:hypothetical protein